MSVYQTVLDVLKNKKINGHAAANAANKRSLKIANKEIKQMLNAAKKGDVTYV